MQRFKIFFKRIFTKGMWGALLNVYKGEFPIYLKHFANFVLPWKYIYLNKLQSSQNLKLHLGSGNIYKEGWINIDISGKADLYLDLREKLPFRSDSVKAIYTEHFLEHLFYPDDAKYFLSECRRILCRKAILRIAVPDQNLILKSFMGRSKEVLKLMQKNQHPKYCKTKMNFINHSFRQEGQHLYSYDFITLEKLLMSVGFRNVRRRKFNKSIDSPSRKNFTLYIEVFKY